MSAACTRGSSLQWALEQVLKHDKQVYCELFTEDDTIFLCRGRVVWDNKPPHAPEPGFVILAVDVHGKARPWQVEMSEMAALVKAEWYII